MTPHSQQVPIPGGELQLDGETIDLHLAARGDAASRLKATVTRMQSTGRQLFVVPEIVGSTAERMDLRVHVPAAAYQPFATVAASWRESLVLNLPHILRFGEAVAASCRFLEESGAALLPLSPLTVWLDTESGSWKSLAVPATAVSFADWARSDPASWGWTASETLLGMAPAGGRYVIGAALHSAITGDLFPPLLSRRERFQRAVRGRVGRPSLLDSLIAAAMPRSFEEERLLLHKVIFNHLAPADSRSSPEESDNLLNELFETVSVRRLSARWEHEGQPAVALHLLQDFARSAPTESVPWEAITRLMETRGDPGGALSTATNALPTGGSEEIRTFLGVLRRSGGQVANAIEPLRTAVARLTATDATPAAALLAAHVRARYLDDRDGARTILNRRLESSWDEVVRAVLLARLCAESEEFELVSRIAKEARAIIATIPFRGGAGGKYADAYLSLLNGIANFAAVARYQNASFLADSYRAFVDAMELALADGASDIIDAATRWLRWICAFTEVVPAPAYATIHTGIRAYLQARGVASANDGTAHPPRVPWYDEETFFSARGPLR